MNPKRLVFKSTNNSKLRKFLLFFLIQSPFRQDKVLAELAPIKGRVIVSAVAIQSKYTKTS